MEVKKNNNIVAFKIISQKIILIIIVIGLERLCKIGVKGRDNFIGSCNEGEYQEIGRY